MFIGFGSWGLTGLTGDWDLEVTLIYNLTVWVLIGFNGFGIKLGLEVNRIWKLTGFGG